MRHKIWMQHLTYTHGLHVPPYQRILTPYQTPDVSLTQHSKTSYMKKETSCTMAIIVLLTIFSSCSKQDQQQDEQSLTTQKVGNNRQGVIYIESNAAQQNSIIAYLQNSNGSLTYLATTSSGGAGTGAPLGSQGALALDETHQW